MFVREQAIAEIERDRCACPGCRGELTAANLSPRGWRHCQACRCAWKIEVIYAVTYASRIAGAVHPLPRPVVDSRPARSSEE
jgi:hypothetical protein